MYQETTQHPFVRGLPRPAVIAHRGFVSARDTQDGVVENTFAAFAAACQAGADVLETDVRVTRDGRVVLVHDRTLERLTGDPVEVASLDCGDLAARLADRGGLLTIEDALEQFPHARWNIDVKVATAAELAGRAVAPHAQRVLLTSFSDGIRRTALDVARETSGGVIPATSAGEETIRRLVTALLSPWPAMRRRIGRLLEGIDALQVPERHGRVPIVTKRLVRAAHRFGIHVHVWTVNDPHRMISLAQLGVDGIVTDNTDRARQVFRRAYK